MPEPSKQSQSVDAQPNRTESNRRVLLIGWDGADWRMIRPMLEAGQMPNFKRFMDEGVHGNIATLQPMLSPMLWTTIATGKYADRHGVLGFAEPDPNRPGKARPVTTRSRRCKAIWNILHDNNRPSGVINWYATHPAEPINGFIVSDRFATPTGPLKQDEPFLGWPPAKDSVHPEDDLETLARARVHPMMISPDQVREFIPAATDEDCMKLEKVRELRTLLAHCATVHNAATAYVEDRPWDFLGIYYDAIDRMAHAFMEYNPPRMSHIDEHEFELYKDVMVGCYKLHDLMLGRMMNLIDENTVVIICSDHGFYSDQRRPEGSSAISAGQPVAWHRTYGIVALWGPGIKQGEQIHGASLLDIAPTVLNLLGMPHARDFDGRPLLKAMTDAPGIVDAIETYEHGDPHLLGPETITTDEKNDAVNEEMLRQLRALGYVGDDSASDVEIDQARNLGTVYLTTGRPHKGIQEFQRVLAAKPDDRASLMSIITAHMQMGELDLCETLLDKLPEDPNLAPRAAYTRALIKIRKQDYARALADLKKLESQGVMLPGLLGQIGRLHLTLKHHDKAESYFNRALTIEPEDPEALDGLGMVYAATRRAPEAVLCFVRALALMRNRPQTHIHLVRALIDAKRYAWAAEAARNAIRAAPRDPRPHELLTTIYADFLDKPRKAAFHRKRAKALSDQLKAQRDKAAARRTQLSGNHPAIRTGSTAPNELREAVTIVTGLPRSGTSLMMQMLEAGGIPALTDDARLPDQDNPKGYYELEAVKYTAQDPSWLDEASGCAVKMITALVRMLPMDRPYRVIIMRRRIEEILDSQEKMLDRLGRQGAAIDPAVLRDHFEADIQSTGSWLQSQPGVQAIEVWYHQLIAEPQAQAARIAAFFAAEHNPAVFAASPVILDPKAMAGVVDPSLYRQRHDT